MLELLDRPLRPTKPLYPTGESRGTALDGVDRIAYAAPAMPKDHRTQFLQIESTPPTRRSEALQLLRIGRSRIQRMLAAESQSELDMRGLFHARRGQELVGAAWGQVIPGRTAFCWPACLVPWEPDETALPLQVAVDDYLDRASVTVVQAVLPVRA